MKPVSVLSSLHRRGSQTDCNYFLPGTGSVWRTKCTQNTLVTIRLVLYKICVAHTHAQTSTHMITSGQACFRRRVHTHTQKKKSWMSKDTKRAQLFPPVVLSCCDYSQGEIDLLINATNAVCFLAI